MLLVALSLLICCSLVCIAILKAWFPCMSLEIPMTRPGIFLLCLSMQAKYPGCGPPYPKGIPILYAEPTAISAPILPGGLNRFRERISATIVKTRSLSFIIDERSEKSFMFPKLSGFCTIIPQYSLALAHGKSSTFPI